MSAQIADEHKAVLQRIASDPAVRMALDAYTMAQHEYWVAQSVLRASAEVKSADETLAIYIKSHDAATRAAIYGDFVREMIRETAE